MTGNEHLPKISVVFNARSDSLCRVHDTASAERDDDFNAFFFAYRNGFFYVAQTRVRLYLEKLGDGNARLFETFVEFRKQGVEEVMNVVGDEHCFRSVFFRIFSDVFRFTGTENNTNGIVEFKIKHRKCPLSYYIYSYYHLNIYCKFCQEILSFFLDKRLIILYNVN